MAAVVEEDIVNFKKRLGTGHLLQVGGGWCSNGGGVQEKNIDHKGGPRKKITDKRGAQEKNNCISREGTFQMSKISPSLRSGISFQYRNTGTHL